MDYSTESLIVDSGFESSLTRRIQNIIFRSHSLKDTDFYKFKEAIVKEYDKAEKDKHIVVKNILKIVVNEFLIRNDAPKDFHGRNQRFFETFYGKEALEKFRELNNKNED